MTALPMHVHLLVVDDDDVDRERVLRLLSRTALTYDAMEASSSACALRLLREHEFDCVMLDNQLGDASGAELLPAIHRESRRDCPVIMITGAGSETLAVQALQEGAADYLTKFGLSADTLSRAIQRALEHHRMRRELDTLHLQLEQRVEEQAAAIRQSERDLRAILDHTPTVIGYWDAGLRNRFGNRAYRRWLGVDPDRLPGRHLGDVIGQDQLAREQPRIDAVLRGESQFFGQDTLAPDGVTWRHAQLSYHPDIGDDGVVRGFYSAINDVTLIKQAQARAEELAAFTEALFEHSPVGLGVYDDSGRCVMGNPALADLLGAPVTDLVGHTLGGLSTDDVLPLIATGRATLGDGLPRRLDVDLQTVYGKPVQAACAWARVEREGRGQLLLVVQDSTEQRRAHDALVTARNTAEQATRTKSEFLANMSHEIRTPMNAIVGLSQLALDDVLPPEARNFIARAHQAALALMGILDDVLDYSKIEAGQLRIEQVPFDIAQVLQRVADLFSARIAQKGLEFIVDIAPGLPRCVLGDPLRLSQVLNNLVGNAVKFTERGQVRLSVRPLDAGAPAPGMFRFAVQDSGIGIAPAQRDALFEAFTQGDGSITRRFGGTGLGLTISRRLVGMMHGTMGFDSAPGVGSVFWFTARLDRAPLVLPDELDDRSAGVLGRAGEPGAADSQAGVALSGGAPPPMPLAGARLLLVEDNDTNRLVAQVFLERMGATVLVAVDGAQAVALLQQAAPGVVDAVLMDLHMPVMDGLEATRRILALPNMAALPVIGMTAAAMVEDRTRCFAAGMVDYVTKPIVVAQLRDVLLHWTGRRPRAAGAEIKLPGFDLAALGELLHGDQRLMRRMLVSFAQQEAQAAAELALLVATDDHDQACRKLHTLRGVAGTLGATELARCALLLEQALRQHGPVKSALAGFIEAMRSTLRALATIGGPPV